MLNIFLKYGIYIFWIFLQIMFFSYLVQSFVFGFVF